LPWQPNLGKNKPKLHWFQFCTSYLKIFRRIFGVGEFKQYTGDISHAFKTAKIIVFDSVMCKTPDAPLQDELLYWTYGDNRLARI